MRRKVLVGAWLAPVVVRCKAGEPVALRVGPASDWEGAPPVAVGGKEVEPSDDRNVGVSDAAIERMEKAGGVTLDDARQEDLVRALRSYLTMSYGYRRAPRPGKLRLRLQRIEKNARALAADLADRSATGASASALIDSLLPETGEERWIYSLKYRLDELSRVALHAAEGLPADRGSAGGNPHLPTLLRSLHTIFENAGGKGRYTRDPYSEIYRGPFLAFAREALKLLRGHRNELTDHVLAEAIRMALLDRATQKT